MLRYAVMTNEACGFSGPMFEKAMTPLWDVQSSIPVQAVETALLGWSAVSTV